MNTHSFANTCAAVLLGFAAVLSLDLTAIRDAGADSQKAESPCDKDGPFSPKFDEGLRRKDLVIIPALLPRIRERHRTPEQERDADRGVCQDAQTGETITLPDPPPRSRKEIDPGGDEGDPSLPRGEKEREGAVRPHFLKAAGIFGNDDRVLQTPTTSFPFRGVVKLLANFPFLEPFGIAVGCTGSFIGGQHVLTAGHCVFNSVYGGWSTSMRVIPALDGTIPPFDVENAPFGDAFMIKHRSSTGWTQDGDQPDDDYAVITLNKTFNVGSFGLFYPSDDFLDSTKACIIGYPSELGNPKGRQQFFLPGCGSIWAYGSKHVEFKMDISFGNSGSGIYVFRNGKRAIFAVVCCGVSPTVGSDYNAGARITKARHDMIRGWQCQDGTQSAC
jgi:V8-like Glu-specific endopeptidase